MNFSDIAERLHAVKTTTGWKAKCPAHEDGTASLTVTEGEDGRTLLHCFAGCTSQAVCAAMGLKVADLYPDKPKRNGRIVASYPYTDENGKLLSEVVRFEPKDFRQRRPDPAGKDGWTWNTSGVRRVLFRLPEVLKGKAAGLPVILAEGEKDVLALVERGFCATCNPGGAGKWLDGYTESLTGADVAIVADKDQPGRAHAAAVAASLQGKAHSVKVLEVPDVGGKPCKDAADFFAAGGSAEELVALVDSTPAWTPTAVPAELPAPGSDATAPAIQGRPLSALVRHNGDDPDELLLFRFLCRLGSLLFWRPDRHRQKRPGATVYDSVGAGQGSFRHQTCPPVEVRFDSSRK